MGFRNPVRRQGFLLRLPGLVRLLRAGSGCYLRETSPAGQSKKVKAKQAAQAFEAAVKAQRTGAVAIPPDRRQVSRITFSKVQFTFCGVEFSFNPVLPVVGGVAGLPWRASWVSVAASCWYLPTSTQLPMYLAAGTSALAVLVSMVTSILTLMTKGTPVDWVLIGTEMVGVAIGSIVGPHTSNTFPTSC